MDRGTSEQTRPGGHEERSFLALAGERAVVIGGLKVAAVVGTVLNAINQGDSLLALRWNEVVWWKVALTYLVPFCVSVFSAARIRRIVARDDGD
jgi:hypothetical protein